MENKSIKFELERIRKLLADQDAGDYASLLERLTVARAIFHDLLAERLHGPFNVHLAELPQQTLAEKQLLAKQAGADLRSLGLSIQCPRTGEPAALIADPGHDTAKGRFQLGLIAMEHGRRRTVSSQTLFPVELRSHFQRRDLLASPWADRVQATKTKSPHVKKTRDL